MAFSLDMSNVFDNAQLLVEGLWPVAALSAGLALGFVILNALRKAIGGIR